MGKLIHNKRIILENMKVARDSFHLAAGLMFRFKKKVSQGMCLVMPVDKDVKFGASITMFFCFVSMDIIFINKKFEVVDKVTLKPWVPNYTPKKPCTYVIESTKGKFRDIKIGDKVKIEF